MSETTTIDIDRLPTARQDAVQAGLRLRTSVNGRGWRYNHNEAPIERAPQTASVQAGLRLKTSVNGRGWRFNHNEATAS